jgi:hypothetical protein
MQWRVVVELSGTAGAVQVHVVHVGGNAMTGCSATTLGLTLAEAKLVLAGLGPAAPRAGWRRCGRSPRPPPAVRGA